VRRYGIYVAFSPGSDLRKEGLGRVLAEFLRAAQDGDVRWTLACPSWLRDSVRQLFEEGGVDPTKVELLAPPREPLALRLRRHLLARRGRQRRGLGLGRALLGLRQRIASALGAAEARLLAATRLTPVLLVYAPTIALLFLAGLLLRGLERGGELAQSAVTWLGSRARRLAPIARLYALARSPRTVPDAQRLYRVMLVAELERMHRLIARRRDIRAWYSPTAFWPSFHRIAGPRLLCVPDIVVSDFAVGFARLLDDRYLPQFREVLDTVDGGTNFVTYSEDVKWRVLVKGRGIDPDAITVIPHGANRLDKLLALPRAPDPVAATEALSRQFLTGAFATAQMLGGRRPLASPDMRFLFYASQSRPNKNILTLLRAYRHLLRDRLLGVRLVLTCHPDALPELRDFVIEQRLVDDVVFLHGLTAQQLAACYRLAELAVNPSLSEGGCPFTLTEALSVGTPVVMARIAVTEEVMGDPALQAISLFDPYDWRDMARRIEWALANRAQLLAAQRSLYETLARREWRHVVADHIALLDRIAAPADAATGKEKAR